MCEKLSNYLCPRWQEMRTSCYSSLPVSLSLCISEVRLDDNITNISALLPFTASYRCLSQHFHLRILRFSFEFLLIFFFCKIGAIDFHAVRFCALFCEHAWQMLKYNCKKRKRWRLEEPSKRQRWNSWVVKKSIFYKRKKQFLLIKLMEIVKN